MLEPMKHYRVYVTIEQVVEYDIHARTEQDAIELVKDLEELQSLTGVEPAEHNDRYYGDKSYAVDELV